MLLMYNSFIMLHYDALLCTVKVYSLSCNQYCTFNKICLKFCHLTEPFLSTAFAAQNKTIKKLNSVSVEFLS